jgi:hypothetical protein
LDRLAQADLRLGGKVHHAIGGEPSSTGFALFGELRLGRDGPDAIQCL